MDRLCKILLVIAVCFFTLDVFLIGYFYSTIQSGKQIEQIVYEMPDGGAFTYEDRNYIVIPD